MKKENERILALVTEITGKTYIPTCYGLEIAIEDLIEYIKKIINSHED